MPLPPPTPGVYWKSYEIDTPTFQLTPVEKPDMSPFLVHMTGKNQIIQILKGENAPTELEKGSGFLKADVPLDLVNKKYTAKVVCFTESPTFALDFFRYRSFPRWNADKRFGLGFDKTNLVTKGIRPVIYTDSELTNQITSLYKHIQNNKQISADGKLNDRLVKLLKGTYPLLFSLLENEKMQGFMWEREWRARDENGFIFSHEDIRIICCPQEEEGIRDILGNSANGIQFIRAWVEYDDVTRFLERQQQTWRHDDESLDQVEQEDQNIQQIRELIEQYQIANKSLEPYQEFIRRLDSDREKIERQSQYLTEKVNNLQTQLAELEKKEEAKKKVLPDSSLGNTKPAS